MSRAAVQSLTRGASISSAPASFVRLVFMVMLFRPAKSGVIVECAANLAFNIESDFPARLPRQAPVFAMPENLAFHLVFVRGKKLTIGLRLGVFPASRRNCEGI